MRCMTEYRLRTTRREAQHSLSRPLPIPLAVGRDACMAFMLQENDMKQRPDFNGPRTLAKGRIRRVHADSADASSA